VTPKTFVCVLDFANVFCGDWMLFYVQFVLFTLSISLRCLYHHQHMVIEMALTLLLNLFADNNSYLSILVYVLEIVKLIIRTCDYSFSFIFNFDLNESPQLNS